MKGIRTRYTTFHGSRNYAMLRASWKGAVTCMSMISIRNVFRGLVPLDEYIMLLSYMWYTKSDNAEV